MEKERRVEAQCLEVDRIAAVLDLPPDHPERRHAESCPRCTALVDSYRAFVEAEPVEGSGLEQTRGDLDAHIRSQAERWMPDTRVQSHSVWWRTLLRPAPILAAGVVLVAAAWWFARAPEESVTRGDVPAEQSIVLHEAQANADGSIVLSWDAVTGADRYRVRIYGPDFHEVYQSADVTATSLTIARDALPAELPRPADLTWEVQARFGTDVIGVSTPGSIRLP
jgi:hypothetical protein